MADGKKLCVLFAGGGTAGPVTPLLAVLEELRAQKPDASFHWIGTRRGPERPLVARMHVAFSAITAAKIDRFLSLRNLIAPFLFLISCWQAYRTLREVRPDVIVAAGAFVAVPVVLIGRLLHIPALIHQLDIRPGLANKLMAPFAKAITVTFEKSLQDFAGEKTFWTGAPVRREILQPQTDNLNLRQGKKAVLIFGGGTGAQAINELVVNALDELTQVAEVIHITGKGKGKPVQRPGYYPFEFLAAEMGEAYAKADLVVTRAGLGTFLELAALRKPAVIIPIPNSHQEDNAMILWEAKAALVLDQTGLSPQEFANAVLKLLGNEIEMARLSAQIAPFYRPSSARHIVEKILEIV